jgi:putative transposase
MVRKGQTFNNYTEKFKREAVMMYEKGYGSYNSISKELGLKSSTQLKNWVKKYRSGESLTDQRGKKSMINHPFHGRPKTKFKSVEDERDYYKAQTEYLKKRYPKLNGGDIPKSQRFQIINEMEKEYPITLLVGIAGVSRARYYKWLKSVDIRRERMKKEQDIKDHIMAIHRVYPEYGCPRITTVLKKQGYFINHKRVYRLMSAMGIKSVIRKKRRYFGKEASVVYPNRVNREFKNRKYNEVLATDITYISFQNRFYYLSVVQDL